MNAFFATIGMGNAGLGIIILVLAVILLISLVLNIINMCTIRKLNKKYQKFMNGKEAKSLEDEIVGLFEDNKFLKASIDKNKKDIRTLYKKLESTIQKVGIVKYDAFHEMGGKLSFSLAMLDMRNNGFIINAMHTREGCYTYIKEIIDGNSVIVLSEEEQEALKRAMNPNSDLKNSNEEY